MSQKSRNRIFNVSGKYSSLRNGACLRKVMKDTTQMWSGPIRFNERSETICINSMFVRLLEEHLSQPV